MKRTLFFMVLFLILIASLTAIQRNKVVVEIGTGAWCTYCPGAAMGADDLVNNGHQVAIIENHNGDPFATTESNGRNSYYAITGYPTAWFDGLNPSVGGSHTVSMYSNYLPKVNARLNVPSHFTINALGNNNGGTYNVNVVIDKVEPDTNTNLRLHFVVTESDIQYSWQGQTHLEFVERIMVPGLAGTTVDFGAGTQVTVPLSFTMNPAWVIANCEVVIFLQNNTTKEILQGTKYTFPEIFGASPVGLTDIDFPDTYITNQATVPLSINNYWSTPLIGSIVSDNPAFVITPANRIDFNIPPYNSMTYMISFVPTTESIQTGNITVTTNLVDYPTIVIPVTGYGFENAAPVATAVTVSGVPVVTIQLFASYTYSDADLDAEGTSVYKWYRITPPSTTPVEIDGAVGLSYRLTSADIGSYIAFEVTPLDSYSMPGTPVMSDPTPLIEVLPAPQNLTAVVQNEHDVALSWEPPTYFSRDFLGYRIFRNGLIINTINFPNITSFTDTWLSDGDYEYWLTSIFTNPISQSDPSNVVSVHIGPVSNTDIVAPVIESMNIYPNPFRSSASIAISSKSNAQINASVYNTKGQLIRNLNGKTDLNGNLQLNLTNDDMQPGIYFVSVKSQSNTITKKIVLIK